MNTTALLMVLFGLFNVAFTAVFTAGAILKPGARLLLITLLAIFVSLVSTVMYTVATLLQP